MLRARRVARWGAAALIVIGLLQLPFVLLSAPFVLLSAPFAALRLSVAYASLSYAIASAFELIAMLTALLWGVVGIALLRAPRTGDATTPMPWPKPA